MRTRTTLVSMLTVVSILLLGSCGQQTAQPEMPTAENEAIQHVNMDPGAVAGDDFYRFANGGWIDENPVPEEFGQYGASHEVWLRNNEQVKAVVTDPALQDAEPGSVARKIADFYSSGMDSAAIDAAGTSTLEAGLDRIDAMRSKKDLAATVAYMHQTTGYPVFVIYPDQDEKDSEQVIANLAQGGLGMSDRDQYFDEDERTVGLREAYKTFMTTVFTLLGDSEAEIKKQIDVIMRMETDLAENSLTRVERRDPIKGYNPMTLVELNEHSPVFDFPTYFKALGVAEPGKLNIRQPNFFKAVSDLAASATLDEWKIYLRWNLIRSEMAALPQVYRDANFAYYGTAVNGTEKPQPRWRIVLGAMNGSIGEAIGKIYVEQHFPPSSKARMEELVANLKIAYAERIKNLDWMTEETKQKALVKLDAIKVKVGYPDKWTDYSSMEIKPDSYADNLKAAHAFHFKKEIAKIGKAVDRDEWFMSPQTVNAYYSPSLNEIVFPAGILQPPFFWPEGDEAVNYGAIGVVIGHEITHGFDDQGRKFDAKGNMEDWWTEADAEAFQEKAQLVVDQYNNFYVTDSVHVNGELTLGENIADLGGLTIAYAALQEALKKHQEPAQIAGFDQDERFYLSYAQIWRGNAREAALLHQVQTDPHSPRQFRVMGPVVNVDPWYAAFEVNEANGMFVEKANRIQIW
ncbi:MAG: M13 family metallopeptidase [Candidatus Marinimicrobia bacterium]|nr:M13 family metallopeptidase [Candidatus Neomarinimicrobiota bacterium]MCF7851047.1 M13 family metallopeptidase [Candidatus Neomarinimicrobiota bacterium]